MLPCSGNEFDRAAGPDHSLADPCAVARPREVRSASIIGDMRRVVGAQLDVDITAPTTLELQIAVAPHPNTQVFESLSFVLNGNPITPTEISGVHGNRIHKFEAPVTACSASARAKSAHRGNRSSGSLASAAARTESQAASSGRVSANLGGGELRWRLMTTAGLECGKSCEPVRR